jgi:UDP-glucose 4-epimerase
MKILFTGASSFTGMWFVKELVLAGHDVTCTFLRTQNSYSGLRKKRIDQILGLCTPHFDCAFGSQKFCDIISKETTWDMLCHHAADVTNYKSPDFDVVAALEKNTHHLKQVLSLLKEKKCNRILLTGSVFEQNEGKGSDQLRAVSPYGLSKGLTFETFQYFTTIFKMKLGKFVIPNPFGPFEELRFTTFLMNGWFAGNKGVVSHPENVRDNIHVSLLAKAYVRFAEELTTTPGLQKINPSGYQESQGDFSQRFAAEMEKRLQIPCEVQILEQKDFTEPLLRLNTDRLDPASLDWNEKIAWDELANYYLTHLKTCPSAL